MKKPVIISVVTLAASLLLSCGKAEETIPKEGISGIQKREGIPVTVSVAKPREVIKERKYSGNVKGILQKDVYASVPEVVSRLRVSIGSRVRKGQIVAELDTRGYTPQYRQAKAQYEAVLKTTERLRKVQAEGGVSQQQLDQAEAQLAAAEAAWDASRKTMKIEAPISGVVTEINVREGEVAPFGNEAPPILQIARLSQATVTIPVPYAEIHLFKKGQTAYTVLQNDTLRGTVRQVPLAANQRNRMFMVEIDFPNKEQLLRPGLYVQTVVQVQKDTDVSIPLTAVQGSEDAYTVFIARGDKAELRKITPRLFGVTYVTIGEALNPGEQVIVQGVSRVKDGDKIKVTADQ